MKKNVLKEAKKAVRCMKGKINAENIVGYIQSMGYVVLFYDPKKEHPIQKMYKWLDYAKDKRGFTAVCRHEKYVFINEEYDFFTQLHTLAHEAGHVTLKHLEGHGIRNKAEEEMEAETFAYILLNFPRKCFVRKILSLIIDIKERLMAGSVAYE